MQKILKWLAPLFAVGVGLFLIFFLISINTEVAPNSVEPLQLDVTKPDNSPQKSWLQNFSKTQKEGYFYPVNEIYVKVDLDEKITKTTTYKLSAVVKDPYQLFCVKEELKQFGLKYFLKKERRGLELLIYSKNIDKLRALVSVLKNYKISAHTELYKED